MYTISKENWSFFFPLHIIQSLLLSFSFSLIFSTNSILNLKHLSHVIVIFKTTSKISSTAKNSPHFINFLLIFFQFSQTAISLCFIIYTNFWFKQWMSQSPSKRFTSGIPLRVENNVEHPSFFLGLTHDFWEILG